MCKKFPLGFCSNLKFICSLVFSGFHEMSSVWWWRVSTWSQFWYSLLTEPYYSSVIVGIVNSKSAETIVGSLLTLHILAHFLRPLYVFGVLAFQLFLICFMVVTSSVKQDYFSLFEFSLSVRDYVNKAKNDDGVLFEFGIKVTLNEILYWQFNGAIF